jgi:nitrogen regulatory protein PII
MERTGFEIARGGSLMYLVLYVLNDLKLFDQVVDAWEKSGVTGITVLPSTGLGRLRHHAAIREDLPLFPSINDFLEHIENSNRTLFTIVKTEKEADKLIDATLEIVGDLDQPDTGILAVLPASKVLGLSKSHPK